MEEFYFGQRGKSSFHYQSKHQSLLTADGERDRYSIRDPEYSFGEIKGPRRQWSFASESTQENLPRSTPEFPGSLQTRDKPKAGLGGGLTCD